MRTGERDSMARRLALFLRHAPEKFNLEMDINGWIDVKDIIKQFKGSNERRYHWLRPHHIRAISETDPKGRYEVRANVIRATYGRLRSQAAQFGNPQGCQNQFDKNW